MSDQIEVFRRNIVNSNVYDPEGIHHEFSDGMHGRKQDFDLIEEGTELYEQWIGVNKSFIEHEFPQLPEIIIGVANGTNRVAADVARQFDGEVLGLHSRKDPEQPKKLHLSPMAGRVVTAMKPELVVVIEDVGTTGSNSVQVATACLEAGAQNVEVVNTWKRRPRLEKLEAAGIVYRNIIDEELPTYSADGCQKDGFCAMGWKVIEYPK